MTDKTDKRAFDEYMTTYKRIDPEAPGRAFARLWFDVPYSTTPTSEKMRAFVRHLLDQSIDWSKITNGEIAQMFDAWDTPKTPDIIAALTAEMNQTLYADYTPTLEEASAFFDALNPTEPPQTDTNSQVMALLEAIVNSDRDNAYALMETLTSVPNTLFSGVLEDVLARTNPNLIFDFCFAVAQAKWDNIETAHLNLFGKPEEARTTVEACQEELCNRVWSLLNTITHNNERETRAHIERWFGHFGEDLMEFTETAELRALAAPIKTLMVELAHGNSEVASAILNKVLPFDATAEIVRSTNDGILKQLVFMLHYLYAGRRHAALRLITKYNPDEDTMKDAHNHITLLTRDDSLYDDILEILDSLLAHDSKRLHTALDKLSNDPLTDIHVTAQRMNARMRAYINRIIEGEDARAAHVRTLVSQAITRLIQNNPNAAQTLLSQVVGLETAQQLVQQYEERTSAAPTTDTTRLVTLVNAIALMSEGAYTTAQNNLQAVFDEDFAQSLVMNHALTIARTFRVLLRALSRGQTAEVTAWAANFITPFETPENVQDIREWLEDASNKIYNVLYNDETERLYSEAAQEQTKMVREQTDQLLERAQSLAHVLYCLNDRSAQATVKTILDSDLETIRGLLAYYFDARAND